MPLDLPEWMGGGSTTVDSSGLLFVCAGAFEGLYDEVYDRITIGDDKGMLKPMTVVVDGQVREELQFDLREWLRNEDLFEYGSRAGFWRLLRLFNERNMPFTSWSLRRPSARSRRRRSVSRDSVRGRSRRSSVGSCATSSSIPKRRPAKGSSSSTPATSSGRSRTGAAGASAWRGGGAGR